MSQDIKFLSPEVTVLLCAFNAEKYIKESIDSILSQSYQNFELLVIDDASTDATLEIVRDFTDARIRIIENKKNLGLTKSLNIGLKEAQGVYIARQDADDISERDRLVNQVSFLCRRPDIVIVGGQYSLIDANSKKIESLLLEKPSSTVALKIYLDIDNPFVHGAVTFRKKTIIELGGYNEEYRTNQDIELWSRVLMNYRGFNLTCPVMRLRIHSESISFGKYKLLIDNARMKHTKRINQLMKNNLDKIDFRKDNFDFITGYTSLYNGQFELLDSHIKIINSKFKELMIICKKYSTDEIDLVSNMIAYKYIKISKFYMQNSRYFQSFEMLLIASNYNIKFIFRYLLIYFKNRIKNAAYNLFL